MFFCRKSVGPRSYLQIDESWRTDGAGLWVSGDGRVGLGHRRLAIIDLSYAGAQEPVAQSVVRVGIGVWHRLVPA